MATTTNAGDTADPARTSHGARRAMRLDDAFREFRERRATRRGLLPTVIPFTGYGSTSWVRVLGRVLLTNDSRSQHPDRSVRGGAASPRCPSIVSLFACSWAHANIWCTPTAAA